MEALAFDDIQNLHQGIQQIYTCHNLDTFPADALKVVDRLVPSDWPLFTLTNTQTGNIYRTLGVQSRTEAIAQALAKLGFLRSSSVT